MGRQTKQEGTHIVSLGPEIGQDGQLQKMAYFNI